MHVYNHKDLKQTHKDVYVHNKNNAYTERPCIQAGTAIRSHAYAQTKAHGQTQDAHKHTDTSRSTSASTHTSSAPAEASPNAPVRPPPGQRRHPQRRRHRRRRRRQRNNKRLSYPITSTWKSCGPTEVTLEDHGSRTHLRRRKERLRLVALSGEAGGEASICYLSISVAVIRPPCLPPALRTDSATQKNTRDEFFLSFFLLIRRKLAMNYKP